MRLTGPIQLLIIALTAQSSASPLAAPVSSDVESRDFTELTSDTAAVGKRSYQNSCQVQGCRVYDNGDNPYMECSCRNTSGNWASTRLNLNDCIANRNGVMTWSKGSVLPTYPAMGLFFLGLLLTICFPAFSGNFGRSCNGVTLSRRVEENKIEASCNTPNGEVYYSSLQLSESRPDNCGP
jgi:hypothetical protein